MSSMAIVLVASSSGFVLMLGFAIYYHFTRKNRVKMMLYAFLLGIVVTNLIYCLFLS